MTSAPNAVLNLVKRFDSQLEAYRSGGYKETPVRHDFIDPLFEALGWDINNESGYAEAYRDVIHEDAIKVGGATKAPDYCFRVGGRRIFFVEAKKPSVNIAREGNPAYQLRRYAWSAKLPLSILTDFEEFAVYDCRIRPKPTDKAAIARTMYLKYTDYTDKWDDIAAIFAKQSVLKGSFDKHVASSKKRGTAEVDGEFLKEIEKWRAALARNIALRNPRLNVRELNFAVQRTIDRVIFLRMAEDRGIERYASLQALISGQRVYPRLMEMFRAADDRYNSGLFHFRENDPGHTGPPDGLTPEIKIDDKVLTDIFKGLYYPASPYEFSVLPADILGNVYEQFLGKVIRLTAGHHARVEEKPEVKKAGGVYYTPKYIVEYIVKHTVGRLITGEAGDSLGSQEPGAGIRESLTPKGSEDGSAAPPGSPGGASDLSRGRQAPEPECQKPGAPKGRKKTPLTPQEIGGLTEKYRPSKARAPLRILDPACGSGSFLVGAYKFLLDYHRDWYVNDSREHPEHRQQNTKYVYQGRGGQWYLTTAEKKRILLSNIYGVDIDSQAVEVTKLNLLLCMLENENQGTIDSQLKMWHERALPDLGENIKCGNSLIGPDFYQGKQMPLFDEEARYRINAFDWRGEFPKILGPKAGKNPGFDAVIGNPPWGQKALREQKEAKEYIRACYESISGIYDIFRPFVEHGINITARHGFFGMVLPDIVLLKDYPNTRLLILQKLSITRVDWWGMAFADAVIDATTVIGQKGSADDSHLVFVEMHDHNDPLRHEIPQRDFLQNERYVFNLRLTSDLREIVARLRDLPKLGDYFEIHEGVHSGNIRSELFVPEKLDESCHELLFGRKEIVPYHLAWAGKYIRLGAVPEKKTAKRYANAGRPEWFNREKLLVRRTGDYVLAAVDECSRYASNNFFIVFPSVGCALDVHGLAALLNSKFMTWFFRTIEPRKGRVFSELKIKHLRVFPLPESALLTRGCEELNEAGGFRAKLAIDDLSTNTPSERTALHRYIAQVEKRIDDWVLGAFDIPEPIRREMN